MGEKIIFEFQLKEREKKNVSIIEHSVNKGNQFLDRAKREIFRQLLSNKNLVSTDNDVE